jgi:LuxR family maltose regulon positive regulatory protein
MNPYLDSTLLHTKLSRPVARASWVERPRLIELLQRSMQGRLTLISAPAGFGKTTLLSQWLRCTDRAVVWVSLDEMDNDPVRFWRYAAEALAPLMEPASAETFKQFSYTLPSMSTSAFLDAFVHQLQAIPHPVALILDDYHTLTEQKIHDSLVYFTEHKPRHVHLLIASRAEAPFPTSRWKVQEELTVITAAQLQFTLEEADSFCRAHSVALEPIHIEQLYRQTEGWVAGLQLVSISLRSETNPDLLIDNFKGSHREVADYLFQEVVAKLPEDIRQFIQRTSILERLDAKACEAVADRTDGAAMLERIKARNLFLLPLDDHDIWFRYHPLFAEFLRARFRRNDPTQWRDAQLAASRSLASRGLLDEAIDHALAAEAFDLAESLLARNAANVLKRGEFPTLLRWLDSFPSPSELSSEMALLHAFLLVVEGQLDNAGRRLLGLEKRFLAMEPGEARQQLQSGLLFVKSNLLFTGGEFEQWFAFTSGILDDILPHNPFYYNFNYNLSEPLVRRTAFGMKGSMSQDTERIGKLFTDVLEKHGWGDSLINLYVVQSLAEGFYEWNRLEDCQKLLFKTERASRLKLVPGLYVPNRITQAKLYWAAGQRALAYETLDEANRFLAKLPESRWITYLHAAKARLLLLEGGVPSAKKELAKLRISAKDKPTYHREYEYLTLAQLLGSQRKETEALRLLELMKPQANREESLIGLVEIGLLQAELYDRMGQRQTAMRALHEALEIGEANGFARSFLDGGERTSKLLAKYRAYREQERWQPVRHQEEAGVTDAYVHRLLSLLAERQTEENEAPSRTVLVEPLTRAEIRLLDLIRQGASNKKIAEKLALSEGSVKVYTSRIYGKLGVSSRTQAVLAAQRLGLLQEA